MNNTGYKPYTDSIMNNPYINQPKKYDSTSASSYQEAYMSQLETQIYSLKREIERKDQEINRLKNENKRLIKENGRLNNVLSLFTKLVVYITKKINSGNSKIKIDLNSLDSTTESLNISLDENSIYIKRGNTLDK